MNYQSLFNFNIHHGYFLDKGQEKYLKVDAEDTEMDDDEKAYTLKKYNVADYLTIMPSEYTKKQFRNYRMLMRLHSRGFRVLVSTLERTVGQNTKYEPIIPLENDLHLTFEIKATDPYFFNYTDAFELSNNRMYLFTNVEPANQDAEFENLFENQGGLIDARFLLKEEQTREVVKTIALEDENFMEYSTGTLPLGKSIQIIQNDPNLTSNQKNTEIETLLNTVIQKKKKSQTIGYVRLSIQGDTNNRHLLEFDGIKQYTKTNTPQFTISFVNLRTFWRFISEVDNATLTTKQKKWLSKNGYVEITSSDFDNAGLDPPTTNPENYSFPNPTTDLIVKEDNNYYSEIFI